MSLNKAIFLHFILSSNELCYLNDDMCSDLNIRAISIFEYCMAFCIVDSKARITLS